MKIGIIGTGYVGLPTAVCLTSIGNHVTCIDIREEKIRRLQDGLSDLFEPGVDDLLDRAIANENIFFTTEYAKMAGCEIVFICVGTPQRANGEADLSYVEQSVKSLAEVMAAGCLVVIKSTVPPGTTAHLENLLRDQLKASGRDIPFSVAFVPEFLKQGKAVSDTLTPDRVVIGADDEDAKSRLVALYKPFFRKSERFIHMNIVSAELAKYAANTMLAMRISYMNELSQLCEKLGADIEDIRSGIGSDSRIGPSFLYAGLGYGGSCFPKDVKALAQVFKHAGLESKLVSAVDAINHEQVDFFYDKIRKHFSGSLQGKTLAVWGLAFKPQTDDIRQSPAIAIIQRALEDGAMIKAHDPEAMENAKKELSGHPMEANLTFCTDPYKAAAGSDALMLVTQWSIYKSPDFEALASEMKVKTIFDGRNIYDSQMLREKGFTYYGVGVR